MEFILKNTVLWFPKIYGVGVLFLFCAKKQFFIGFIFKNTLGYQKIRMFVLFFFWIYAQKRTTMIDKCLLFCEKH